MNYSTTFDERDNNKKTKLKFYPDKYPLNVSSTILTNYKKETDIDPFFFLKTRRTSYAKSPGTLSPPKYYNAGKNEFSRPFQA